MTTIYLVRHGEAEGNAFRRIHGQYDSLLTPNGLRQAECVRQRFENVPVDACFSSDLTRTSLTARSIFVPKGLPLRRNPAFREVCLGRWEDTPFGYLETFEPEAMALFNQNPPAWHMEGAEPYPVYTGRFIDAMEDAARQFPGGTIAIFCHGAVLRGVLARLFFADDVSRVPYCDNTAVSRLFWDARGFTYDYLNDNSHVPLELSTFARQKWWRQGSQKDYNLWYQPMEPGENPAAFRAMLGQTAVGTLCLNPQTGVVETLYLEPEFRGRDLEDQFLGQAVSCLRRWGYGAMTAQRGSVNPPEVLDRYGFVQMRDVWQVNIDTGVYHWD